VQDREIPTLQPVRVRFVASMRPGFEL
jgi:hypothetical protein